MLQKKKKLANVFTLIKRVEFIDFQLTTFEQSGFFCNLKMARTIDLTVAEK